MLQTKALASFLQDKLNLASQSSDLQYIFTIVPEVGDIGAVGSVTDIKGRLRRIESLNSPIRGFINSLSKYNFEIIVPCPKGASNHVGIISELVDVVIEEINGASFNIGNGQVVFDVSSGIVPGEIKNAASFGQHVILLVQINAQYSEGITTYNDYIVEIKIPGLIENYARLPLNDIHHRVLHNVSLAQDITNVRDGVDYNQNFIRTITITFYALNTEAVNAIVNNYILDSSKTKVSTNDEIWLKITRYETTNEYQVKIMDAQAGTPNNLGYENVTLVFTKYSLDDMEEEDDAN